MLYNVSKKKKIIETVKLADSLLKKFKGLMFEREKNFNYALVFDLGKNCKRRASIHMCFVFFPIDVLFLNEERKVVDIVLGLKPWTLNYTPKKNSRYIIELPKGRGSGIEERDKISWRKNFLPD